MIATKAEESEGMKPSNAANNIDRILIDLIIGTVVRLTGGAHKSRFCKC